MNELNEPATGEIPGNERLTNWLIWLVRGSEDKLLAQLRSPEHTDAHTRASLFAEEPADREVYEGVARLFAIYHTSTTVPRYGYGSLGTALCMAALRAKQKRDQMLPKGLELSLDRLASSGRIRWRNLEHAIRLLRTAEASPPAWSQLTLDLAEWPGGRRRSVAQGWVADFYKQPPWLNKKSAA